MYLKIYLYSVLLMMIAVSCSSSETAVSETKALVEKPDNPDEYISLNINETLYFEFSKYDTVWTGSFTLYTLNDEGEKVVKSKYMSAKDSSWDDLGLFISFLHIYEIGPQYEIDGWVPDSGQLPKRVYNFEIFDGDTTRSFSYQDPINDILDYWQAQNLLTFVTFIENDLRWVEKGNIER